MKQNLFIHSFPDFLGIQRLSYLWFLAFGVRSSVNKFPTFIKFKGEKYVINPEKYFFQLPEFTSTDSKLEDLTYCLSLVLQLKKDLYFIPSTKVKSKSFLTYKKKIKLFKHFLVKYNQLNPQKCSADTDSHSKFFLLEKNSLQLTHLGYQTITIGEIPLLSEEASFIINGTEKALISQMVRSPGVSFQRSLDKKTGNYIFTTYLISDKSSWLKFDFPFQLENFQQTREASEYLVKLDNGEEFPLCYLLYSFGLNKNRILEMSRYPEYLLPILENGIRESDQKNWDITSFLSNDKIQAVALLCKYFVADSLINNLSNAWELLNVFYQSRYFCIGESGRYRLNQYLKLNVASKVTHLTPLDLIAILDRFIEIQKCIHSTDELDDLSNKKLCASGIIAQNLLSVGVDRFVRHASEFTSKANSEIFDFFDSKFITLTFKEFFNTSEISQFLDNINPLAELTHKRRVTVLGTQGLSTENASLEMRDIHSSQYGRLCPIETPDGQKAGLVTTLATCAQLNVFGFLSTPYFLYKNGKAYIYHKPRFLDSRTESNLPVCSSDIVLTNNCVIGFDQIPVRVNNKFYLSDLNSVNFLSISPFQLFSIATCLIPFLEHNDANRVLMGASMQRQAVPLLHPQKPIVGTGLEFAIAYDSGMSIKSYTEGIVLYASSEKIIIGDSFGQKIIYSLKKYLRTNGDSCLNQKPIIWPGEKIFNGQIIADGPAMNSGELSLGSNLLVAYMSWEGYNFEDAVIISENVVLKDLLTSIHIEEYETEICETERGPERLTNNIRTLRKKNLRNVDENGLVLEGSYVRSGDLLVGKVTPIEEDESPEAKLLKAIFRDNYNYRYKDSSLCVPKGCEGRVIDVRMLPKTQLKEGEDADSVIAVIRIFIAQTRKIVNGDKVAGRHGNKGIISRIAPIQDMPYLPDGTPIDIILNPLGVPSRMNVGQLFEALLGFAGEKLKKRYKIIPFDEVYGKEASRVLVTQKMKEASLITQIPWLFNDRAPGKILLRDGQTGELFDNPIFVGKSYILKLMHLVDDKIHARATGPYALVTQQPLAGRSRNGGQRFGEMEVWALEAYGAAYTLQEILTIRSDDIEGRNITYDALIHGRMPPTPQIPEAFNVLIRELRALGLDLFLSRINTGLYFSNDQLIVSVDILDLFEKKLELHSECAYLNPRTRILQQEHTKELKISLTEKSF